MSKHDSSSEPETEHFIEEERAGHRWNPKGGELVVLSHLPDDVEPEPGPEGPPGASFAYSFMRLAYGDQDDRGARSAVTFLDELTSGDQAARREFDAWLSGFSGQPKGARRKH